MSEIEFSVAQEQALKDIEELGEKNLPEAEFRKEFNQILLDLNEGAYTGGVAILNSGDLVDSNGRDTGTVSVASAIRDASNGAGTMIGDTPAAPLLLNNAEVRQVWIDNTTEIYDPDLGNPRDTLSSSGSDTFVHNGEKIPSPWSALSV